MLLSQLWLQKQILQSVQNFLDLPLDLSQVFSMFLSSPEMWQQSKIPLVLSRCPQMNSLRMFSQQSLSNIRSIYFWSRIIFLSGIEVNLANNLVHIALFSILASFSAIYHSVIQLSRSFWTRVWQHSSKPVLMIFVETFNFKSRQSVSEEPCLDGSCYYAMAGSKSARTPSLSVRLNTTLMPWCCSQSSGNRGCTSASVKGNSFWQWAYSDSRMDYPGLILETEFSRRQNSSWSRDLKQV